MMPSTPLDDSRLGGRGGTGEATLKKLKETADVWGKLPEKERAKAMLELTRNMDPQYKEAVEAYLKKLQAESGAR
jgi:hypothetical protein